MVAIVTVATDSLCLTLFCGSTDGLRAYFEKYGEVTDCVVMSNAHTGRSRCVFLRLCWDWELWGCGTNINFSPAGGNRLLARMYVIGAQPSSCLPLLHFSSAY